MMLIWIFEGETIQNIGDSSELKVYILIYGIDYNTIC